ncbi:heavy-metal-associated domain-containing protein [Phycisphaera mikurensis]|uniref:Hypothetical membrane protein n=1 Tax=Phycisphaera mikurensis (strain NBRC 102666 / KCTC 22515 / FYK2301M01) TaxID=1142394 RepID=I0IGL4_PHYMF|nr:heavy metal-associated domain-containing protein [Phycisphaera mikurensis]MBB6442916.1 copper chaperone CopZ [Phycisphaera mikurensis]BAM04402.1 hypothetical membrane protein [Phycisphaera mikurensis NBRC 102666]
MKHDYAVTGMHCASCVAKIQDALNRVDGVEGATVTLDPPRASVRMDRHVPLEELDDAVAGAGAYHLAEASAETPAASPPPEAEPSLFPLYLIVGYLLAVVLAVAAATGRWEAMPMMRHFMAGFFLVFSFFKLLDLPGFVSTFRGYDLFARRSKAYAYAYPFVELALGFAYLLALFPVVTNAMTLAIMGFGAVGVLRALLGKQSIRCACLGTALNLPMTRATLIENLTMAAMAAVMLVLWLAD